MGVDRRSLVDVAEIIGAVAVVIGLVFVAVEINQNTRMQRVTATQALVLDYENALEKMATSEETACIYVKGINGLDNLNSIERYRFFVIWFHIFRAAEQLHYYSLEGMVEPRIWRGFERQIAEISQLPGVKEWWAIRKNWFSDDYQHYIDDVMASGTPIEPQLFMGDGCPG